ncbi:MAG TPA: hypothetical protein VFU47_16560 [Armatimonadota bacterium]|nr:hypothetical protein [Armatimonadota bacterium]
MRVLAIDPGPEHSAVCLYDTGSAGPIRATWTTNAHALEMARFGVLCDGETICERADVLAIEKVISYGQLVGAPTFETVYWSGRFAEAWGGPVVRISQPQAKSHLCYTPNAKDAQWRAALLARFGGKGTKKAPGRLYGFNEHRWSALLIAVAVADLWWERGADGGPVLPVEGEENGD